MAKLQASSGPCLGPPLPPQQQQQGAQGGGAGSAQCWVSSATPNTSQATTQPPRRSDSAVLHSGTTSRDLSPLSNLATVNTPPPATSIATSPPPYGVPNGQAWTWSGEAAGAAPVSAGGQLLRPLKEGPHNAAVVTAARPDGPGQPIRCLGLLDQAALGSLGHSRDPPAPAAAAPAAAPAHAVPCPQLPVAQVAWLQSVLPRAAEQTQAAARGAQGQRTRAGLALVQVQQLAQLVQALAGLPGCHALPGCRELAVAGGELARQVGAGLPASRQPCADLLLAARRF
ncbi:hypothetical protein V8C86DRAFT_2546166, partial [Haematococcus lacustris]